MVTALCSTPFCAFKWKMKPELYCSVIPEGTLSFAGWQDALYSMCVSLNLGLPHQILISGTKWSSSWARPRQNSWRNFNPQWGTMSRTGQSTQASPSPNSSPTAFSLLTLSTTNSKVRTCNYTQGTCELRLLHFSHFISFQYESLKVFYWTLRCMMCVD